jgi:23S rRNA (adenine2030-N6)-methyltransferase
MFSYRHGFHAGNHADVLKHVVLVQLLAHMVAKEKPFTFVDSHAGAGAYSLATGSYAAKTAEFNTGIARLWSESRLPGALDDYVQQIRSVNPGGNLLRYPGSPQIALQMMRPHDRLRLFELHPTEAQVLQDYFHADLRRVSVRRENGFDCLKSVLPPPSRRALTLVDPSYEDKDDYVRVVGMMREALVRFPTGVYAVWYPEVKRRESDRLPEQLQRLAGDNWLHASLTISAPPADGLGLFGSGMFIFNPPWQLDARLRESMPALKALLGSDRAATFGLQGKQR